MKNTKCERCGDTLDADMVGWLQYWGYDAKICESCKEKELQEREQTTDKLFKKINKLSRGSTFAI